MQYQSECLSALKSAANEILMYGGNFVIKGDGARQDVPGNGNS